MTDNDRWDCHDVDSLGGREPRVDVEHRDDGEYRTGPDHDVQSNSNGFSVERRATDGDY